MTHHLVQQLHFARSEFVRCLDGVSNEDGVRRIQPMNCISWIIGHLAYQENSYWVLGGQNKEIAPGLYEMVGYGQPASTPPLDEMWEVWNMVTKASDDYLDLITPEILETHLEWRGRQFQENVVTLLLRNIYHYWFHLGEAHAIRQLLGHTELPEFVGDMTNAHYKRE